MKKIKKIAVLILNILVLSSLFINCYATLVPVTKENLNASLQDLKNYKITVSDNIITIKVNGESYTLNYNLAEKPKFTLEIPIEKGMSYKDFKNQTDNLILPMIGYVAVANIQGIKFEDASAYFLMSYLENALNGSWSSENSYVIIDDTNMSDGVTIDRNESNRKTIYASEFGERVMEFVNDTYKDKQIIRDSSNGINSYEWTTERKDITDTSCKILSSLTVNLDADFSKLNGYGDKNEYIDGPIKDGSLNKDITKENADYTIDLKVGQKCRIETTEKIGYELFGIGGICSNINENCIEITGVNVGATNGYIYDGKIKKTIFITIEENIGSTQLDTITLKIDNSDKSDKQKEEKQNINNTDRNNIITDSTTSKTSFPKTGSSRIIYIVIFFSISLIIIFSIKLKNIKI